MKFKSNLKVQSKSQLTNFENIEEKFANVVISEEYKQLVNLFEKQIRQCFKF